MTTTPIIYDFDAIRKPKPAAAIASLFREWISAYYDESDFDQIPAALNASLREPLPAPQRISR